MNKVKDATADSRIHNKRRTLKMSKSSEVLAAVPPHACRWSQSFLYQHQPGTSSGSCSVGSSKCSQDERALRCFVREHRTDEGTVAENRLTLLPVITVTHPPTRRSAFRRDFTAAEKRSVFRRTRLFSFSSGRLNGSSSRGSGRTVGGRGREPSIRGHGIRWWGDGCGSQLRDGRRRHGYFFITYSLTSIPL